ncbi:phosphoribosyl-ATP pyrophosphohydrolase [Asticcacaulis sp. BYS171W]|uniref:Phosphoribosyl-ATP pyrophosphohydrolase n=1 Tax=Asticcacaulis aquaticus TaxID=2984212 RepID=A0ABT5HTP2_9CAUL|nr:phosphoribosyl-ATP pyrophosphohydrolase [Asticcacaulis aquaticus]MDC7683349.1 phosphoribosyl-ATP pyrophosphohydrolase [Asticcacaulis aquaticus]
MNDVTMTQPLPGLEPFIDRLKAISDRYERVHGIDRGGDWHLLKVQEEIGELTQAYLAMTGRSRRDADGARHEVAMEMADVVCMIFLMARDQGIDLNAAIQEKWMKWEQVMRDEASA